MAISTYNDLSNLIEAWWPENAVLSGSNVTSLPGTYNSKTLAVTNSPQIVNGGLPGGNKSIETGTGDYLRYSAANIVSGTTFTLLAMVKLVGSVLNGQRVFSWAPSGGLDWNTASGAVMHPWAGAHAVYWPEGFRNSVEMPWSATNNVAADTWHLVMCIYDGTNCTYYYALSGASGWTTVGSVGSTGTFDIDTFTIGADQDGADDHPIEFGDVVWYSDAKGSTDRDDLWTLANERNFNGVSTTTATYGPGPIMPRRR